MKGDIRISAVTIGFLLLALALLFWAAPALASPVTFHAFLVGTHSERVSLTIQYVDREWPDLPGSGLPAVPAVWQSWGWTGFGLTATVTAWPIEWDGRDTSSATMDAPVRVFARDSELRAWSDTLLTTIRRLDGEWAPLAFPERRARIAPQRGAK